jgi:hypothetical protein
MFDMRSDKIKHGLYKSESVVLGLCAQYGPTGYDFSRCRNGPCCERARRTALPQFDELPAGQRARALAGEWLSVSAACAKERDDCNDCCFHFAYPSRKNFLIRETMLGRFIETQRSDTYSTVSPLRSWLDIALCVTCWVSHQHRAGVHQRCEWKGNMMEEELVVR